LRVITSLPGPPSGNDADAGVEYFSSSPASTCIFACPASIVASRELWTHVNQRQFESCSTIRDCINILTQDIILSKFQPRLQSTPTATCRFCPLNAFHHILTWWKNRGVQHFAAHKKNSCSTRRCKRPYNSPRTIVNWMNLE
jgi:hypothetical protein